MNIVLGLVALAAFAYLVYREMSKPNKTGTGSGGSKPDDYANPDKK